MHIFPSVDHDAVFPHCTMKYEAVKYVFLLFPQHEQPLSKWQCFMQTVRESVFLFDISLCAFCSTSETLIWDLNNTHLMLYSTDLYLFFQRHESTE